MPVYEYTCVCGYKGDLVVTISDRDRTICPQCGKVLQRMMSVVNLGRGKQSSQVILSDGSRVRGEWINKTGGRGAR